MATMLRSAGLALMMTSAGCMAHQATHTAAPPTSSDGAAPSGMPPGACPMAVPGTQVSAVDRQNGEAITFTTSPDHEADLRSRVHAMADMHNHHQGGGTDHGGMHQDMHGDAMGDGSMGSGDMDHHMTMMPPPSSASVEDIPGGARLVVTPSDPAELQRLQSVVRMHAAHMSQTRSCGMGEHGNM